MSTPCCGILSAKGQCHSLARQRTESRTLPNAFSSASTLSFLRCSSAKVRCAVRPFTMGWEVGPEGTVGAWMLLMVDKPNAENSCSLWDRRVKMQT